jgi:hypothetical protein
MSEPQDAVQDLMSRYGFEEAEARAYYYLDEARKEYRDMVIAEAESMGKARFAMLFSPHFRTLRNDIIRRAWEREHLDSKEPE